MGLGGLMVAAGGALGAAGRYGISLLPWRGFTTFSTFSLESFTLLERGKWLLCGGYMFLSVALCLLGVALGQRLSGDA